MALCIINKLSPSVTARESELWEMEQQQIQEKHQLLKHQLKEAFFMHRHQMHMKHKKVSPVMSSSLSVDLFSNRKWNNIRELMHSRWRC